MVAEVETAMAYYRPSAFIITTFSGVQGNPGHERRQHTTLLLLLAVQLAAICCEHQIRALSRQSVFRQLLVIWFRRSRRFKIPS